MRTKTFDRLIEVLVVAACLPLLAGLLWVLGAGMANGVTAVH